jgi:gamma-glutamyltranspeptidase/glutathione hydrolase
MTGIGGDAFCLYYDAATKTVRGLNGSGRAPSELDLATARAAATAATGDLAPSALPIGSVHCVTVPGAAAAWCDTLSLFGSGMPLSEVLAPAIELAEGGFAVAPVSALSWRELEYQLTRWAEKGFDHPGAAAFLPGGCAPHDGQWVTNPELGATFRLLAEHGKPGFYGGCVAEAMVATVRRMGGTLSMADLARHSSEEVTPLSVEFEGHVVWELPPNGQGLVALLCLSILKQKMDSLRTLEPNSAAYLHLLAEALRLAFAQGAEAIADPTALAATLGVEWGAGESSRPRALWEALLSHAHAAALSSKVDASKAMDDAAAALPRAASSETVYLCAVDGAGNACSFINSNYAGFGTGIVPDGCGFSLQNRGANFSLMEGHPNALGPGKRPYHTIIPGMLTRSDGALAGPFGVMGGFMQPQGHVQVAHLAPPCCPPPARPSLNSGRASLSARNGPHMA